MSKAETTLVVFSLYLIVVAGLGLILIPETLLGLFGLTAQNDGWIRMIGMLASIIGIYYFLAVRTGFSSFYRWTVPVRIYAALFMVAMVVLGKIGTGLLVFAAIDAVAALWTWSALKSEGSEQNT